MDRCDHTELPTEACAHCRPAPAPIKAAAASKSQPTPEAARAVKTYAPRKLTRPTEPDDWRKQAACAKEDPDLHFPEGTTGRHLLQAEQAKDVCRRCPVMLQCRAWAMETRQDHGVWGALDEAERRSIRRGARRHSISPAEAAAKKASQPPKPSTLQDIFDAGTARLHGGHLAWTGKAQIRFDGQVYTPKQLCFLLDRGHPSTGRVMSDCNVSECVLPQHLADTAERSRCPSRSGYQRHLRLGETPCDGCRNANTDADNRLRRTGTTKAAA